MKELNLTEPSAIDDFFGKEESVMIEEKTKITYVNEVGEETAFKAHEGFIITREMISPEPVKSKKKKG